MLAAEVKVRSLGMPDGKEQKERERERAVPSFLPPILSSFFCLSLSVKEIRRADSFQILAAALAARLALKSQPTTNFELKKVL